MTDWLLSTEIMTTQTTTVQGRSQDFTLRGGIEPRAEGARIEAPKSPRGVRIGEGVSWAPPAGSGALAEPRPPTHFWQIWGQQNTSGREKSPKIAGFFSVKNPLNRRWGGMPPLNTPLPPFNFTPTNYVFILISKNETGHAFLLVLRSPC